MGGCSSCTCTLACGLVGLEPSSAYSGGLRARPAAVAVLAPAPAQGDDDNLRRCSRAAVELAPAVACASRAAAAAGSPAYAWSGGSGVACTLAACPRGLSGLARCTRVRPWQRRRFGQYAHLCMVAAVAVARRLQLRLRAFVLERRQQLRSCVTFFFFFFLCVFCTGD